MTRAEAIVVATAWLAVLLVSIDAMRADLLTAAMMFAFWAVAVVLVLVLNFGLWPS